MGAVRQILAVIASDAVFSQFEPLVRRSDLSLTRVRSGQHALTLTRDLSYELIIGQYPLNDLGFAEFHAAIRSSQCASRHARLLVLTRDDRLDALSESLDDEDAQLFCVDLAPEQIEMALAEILGVAVRARSRLLVDTRLDCTNEPTHRVFQTVDISESGLLLRSHDPLPIGTRPSFALNLPDFDEPIRGLAEVVRHTRPERERIEGMALRFLRVEEEDRARLAEFVRQRVPKAT